MSPPRARPAITVEALLRGLSSTGARLGDEAGGYLGREVAGALAEAHATLDEEGLSTPLLHLRLSPRCVLVGEDGEVRLAEVGEGEQDDDPAFAAPEQRAGERCTTRTDAYRLGALIGSLLPTGRRPPGLAAALATAAEPAPARRRITCLELQLWLAELGGAAAGKAALGALVRERMEADAAAPAEPSRPLSFLQAVAVALLTAAAVVAAGVYAMERGFRP
jgi:eukaryotic-like serine/threonine-protein kinase